MSDAPSPSSAPPAARPVRLLAVVALLALLLGGLAGWFLGRYQLQRQWSQPEVLVSAADAQRSSAGNADPTPAAGTRVLHPAPLRLSRARLAARRADPVQCTVGAVGRGDEGAELHLTLRNQGRCAVTSVEGVGYGFDAWGRPAQLNRGGEHYVAFRETLREPLAPGEHSERSFPLRFALTASVALAQVDRVGCADGTVWTR